MSSASSDPNADATLLIADLLDVTRIEAGNPAVRNASLDLRALIAEIVDRFAEEARARKIALRSAIDDDVPTVAGDRDRLIQVLSNLLGNALKFTPEGQSITILATRADGAAQIAVEDSGSGISDQDLPHIFDRFWQAQRQSRAGAGLGLAICKGIVEAHGGRIWASRPVGRGTSMCFTLPALSR